MQALAWDPNKQDRDDESRAYGREDLSVRGLLNIIGCVDFM